MGENQRLVLARQLVRGGEPCGRGGLCGLGGDHSTPPVEREGRVPASGSGPASVWGWVWGSGWGFGFRFRFAFGFGFGFGFGLGEKGAYREGAPRSLPRSLDERF